MTQLMQYLDSDVDGYFRDIVARGFSDSGFLAVGDRGSSISCSSQELDESGLRLAVRSYVSSILMRFYRIENLPFRHFRKIDDTPELLEDKTMYVFEMLGYAYDPRVGDSGKERAFTHAGDFSTFCAGLFPEWLEYRNLNPRSYTQFASAAYAEVAAIKIRKHGNEAAFLFHALSRYSSEVVAGLNCSRELMNIGKADWELSLWRFIEGKMDWMDD